ncbi:prolipoprotein diacylglyceryl transferase [bacterium]|nr:prolipoprotein diacylglyceryl transferase [candidate division CSSED10-310 bacterium]
MHPDLFSIGPFTVHSYGTMIVIGFLMGLLVIRIRASQVNISKDLMMDLAFGLLIAGFIGAKFFYWLVIPSSFVADARLLVSDPLGFIKNLGNGFEFFGGIASGVFYFLWYSRRHHLDRSTVLDLLTPSVPLAHAFGRIGCFMAGCCYGRQCSASWAVTFNDPHTLAPRGVPIHPTQIYESVLLFILTAALLRFDRQIKRIPGRMVSVYILGYTIIRFIVEYFRGDNRGQLPGTILSGTQIIALCIAAGATIWLIYLYRNHRGLNGSNNN